MGFETLTASVPELRAFTQAFGRILRLLCGPRDPGNAVCAPTSAELPCIDSYRESSHWKMESCCT